MDCYDIAYKKANEMMKPKLSDIPEPMYGIIRDRIADGIAWAVSNNEKIQALLMIERMETDA